MNETDTRVLQYLVREADMDGLVTTVAREIAEAVGVSKMTISNSLRRLEEKRQIQRLSRGHGCNRPGTAITSEFRLTGASE